MTVASPNLYRGIMPVLPARPITGPIAAPQVQPPETEISTAWKVSNDGPTEIFFPSNFAVNSETVNANLVSLNLTAPSGVRDALTITPDTSERGAFTQSHGTMTVNGHTLTIDQNIASAQFNADGTGGISTGPHDFDTMGINLALNGSVSIVMTGTLNITAAPGALTAIGGYGQDHSANSVNFLGLPNPEQGPTFALNLTTTKNFTDSISTNPMTGLVAVDIVNAKNGHVVTDTFGGTFDPHDILAIASGSLITLSDSAGHELGAVTVNADGTSSIRTDGNGYVSTFFKDANGNEIGLMQVNSNGTGFFFTPQSNETVHIVAGQQFATPTFNADGSADLTVLLASGAATTIHMPGNPSGTAGYETTFNLGGDYIFTYGGAHTPEAIQDITVNADGGVTVSALQPGFSNSIFTIHSDGTASFTIAHDTINFVGANIVTGINTSYNPTTGSQSVYFDLTPVPGYSHETLAWNPTTGQAVLYLEDNAGHAQQIALGQINGSSNSTTNAHLDVTNGGTQFTLYDSSGHVVQAEHIQPIETDPDAVMMANPDSFVFSTDAASAPSHATDTVHDIGDAHATDLTSLFGQTGHDLLGHAGVSAIDAHADLAHLNLASMAMPTAHHDFIM